MRQEGKREKLGKQDDGAKERTFPGRVAHHVQFLLPVVEGPFVRKVDFPRADPLIFSAYVLQSAYLWQILVWATELALVDLTLDEKGELVVEEVDAGHSHASRHIGKQEKKLAPTSLRNQLVNKLASSGLALSLSFHKLVIFIPQIRASI